MSSFSKRDMTCVAMYDELIGILYEIVEDYLLIFPAETTIISISKRIIHDRTQVPYIRNCD